MKNKFFIIIACLLMTNIIAAQDDDPKAVQLLNEVSQKMNNYQSLKLEFNFFVEDLHDASRDSFSGVAIYKDGYYRLELMGQILFSDGKTNWTYLIDADEVNIVDNVDEDDSFVDPKNILKDFEKEYKVRYISHKFERNRPLTEVDLYPINTDDKKYSRISLRIDNSKKQIYSVRYVGKHGVNYMIEIYRFVENPEITDNKIRFSESLFPGAEIIDMRY